MDQKQLKSTLGLFLIFTGLSAFTISLFNKQTRRITQTFMKKGGVLFIDFLLEKYLPQQSPQLAKIVNNQFQIRGNKGGKVTKKRHFKRPKNSSPLKAF